MLLNIAVVQHDYSIEKTAIFRLAVFTDVIRIKRVFHLQKVTGWINFYPQTR